MVTLTVTELKEKHPERFEKEYYEWLEYAGDYDWYGFHTDHFKEEMLKLGLDVFAVDLDSDSYNRFIAIVRGSMRLATLMKLLGKDEEYLPLYLDALDTQHMVMFSNGWRNRQNVEIEESYSYESPPQGVFSGMEPDEWRELVEEQANNEDWAQLALDWLKPHTDKLADDLSEDYEYITSEEEFIASCEVNDVTFEVEEEDDEI